MCVVFVCRSLESNGLLIGIIVTTLQIDRENDNRYEKLKTLLSSSNNKNDETESKTNTKSNKKKKKSVVAKNEKKNEYICIYATHTNHQKLEIKSKKTKNSKKKKSKFKQQTTLNPSQFYQFYLFMTQCLNYSHNDWITAFNKAFSNIVNKNNSNNNNQKNKQLAIDTQANLFITSDNSETSRKWIKFVKSKLDFAYVTIQTYDTKLYKSKTNTKSKAKGGKSNAKTPTKSGGRSKSPATKKNARQQKPARTAKKAKNSSNKAKGSKKEKNQNKPIVYQFCLCCSFF